MAAAILLLTLQALVLNFHSKGFEGLLSPSSSRQLFQKFLYFSPNPIFFRCYSDGVVQYKFWTHIRHCDSLYIARF